MQSPAPPPITTGPVDPWLALNTLPDPCIIVDPHGAIVYTNLAARQLRADQATLNGHDGIGDPLLAYHRAALGLSAADAATLEAALVAVLGGDRERAEAQLVYQAAGESRWLALTIVPFGDGRTGGALVQHHDITAHKQAEAAMERSQTFLTSIVENIPDMVIVKDAADLRFVRFNKAGEELLGLSRAELIGKTDHDFFPAEEADFFNAKDREVLAGGRMIDIPEEPIETHHLGRRLLHTKKIPILDEQGQPKYLLAIAEDITERRRAEEALRQSELRYQKLLANVPGMIYQFVLHPDGTNVFPIVSDGCRELLGVEPRQLQDDGNVLINLLHPDDRQSFIASVMQSAQTLRRWRWEGRVVLPSGEQKWIQAISRPEAQASGDMLWDGLLLDVTARKQAEAAQHRFAAILEATPDFVGIADPQGAIVYLNHAGRELLGLTPEQDLLGQQFSRCHPAWAQAILELEALPQAIRDGVWVGETALISRTGAEIPVSQVVIAHKNSAGEVEFLSTLIRDLTDRKRTEAVAAENERLLTQFMEALPVGVFVVDAVGRPYYANRTAQQLMGRGVVPDTTIDTLIEVYQAFVAGTDQLYPTERTPIVRALGGERARIDDMELKTPDGRVRLEVTATPIYDAQQQLIYAIGAFNDITERKQAEAALLRSVAQEEQIRAQEAALAEISTPLFPISDNVLVLPLVGAVDGRRAQQMIEVLLQGVQQHSARVVLVDITGVSLVDTQVANVLIQAAQAVKLLGAEVVITGIRPEVAQTLIGLGVDLRGIITRSSLQTGVAYALERR